MPDQTSSTSGLPSQTPTHSLLNAVYRRSSFQPGHVRAHSSNAAADEAEEKLEDDDADEGEEAQHAKGEGLGASSGAAVADSASASASSLSSDKGDAAGAEGQTTEPQSEARGARLNRSASVRGGGPALIGRKDNNSSSSSNSNSKTGRAAKRTSMNGQGLARGNSSASAGPSTTTGKGLTWDAATAKKLQWEFDAQEMILKGLQDDNERKTVEVEQLRKEKRTMVEFLKRNHGDGWHILVFGAPSGSSSAGAKEKSKDDEDESAGIEAFGFPAGSGNSAKVMKVLSGTGSDGGSGDTGSDRKTSSPFTQPAPSAAAASAAAPAPASKRLRGRRTGSPLKMQAFSASARLSAGPDDTRADTSLWDEASFVSAAAGEDEDGDDGNGEDGPVTASSHSDERVNGGERGNDGGDEASEREPTPRLAPGALPPSGFLSSVASSGGRTERRSSADVQDISAFLAGPGAPTSPSAQASSALPAPAQTLDIAALLAQMEAMRMIIQGFARSNARRDAEMKELEVRAKEAGERGREDLKEAMKAFA